MAIEEVEDIELDDEIEEPPKKSNDLLLIAVFFVISGIVVSLGMWYLLNRQFEARVAERESHSKEDLTITAITGDTIARDTVSDTIALIENEAVRDIIEDTGFSVAPKSEAENLFESSLDSDIEDFDGIDSETSADTEIHSEDSPEAQYDEGSDGSAREEKVLKVARIISNMDPRMAAAMLENMDKSLAAEIMLYMQTRASGEIMSEISPQKASEMSKRMIE